MQGNDHHSSGVSQCNCCDQCGHNDNSVSTVSKLLSDLSTMLVDDTTHPPASSTHAIDTEKTPSTSHTPTTEHSSTTATDHTSSTQTPVPVTYSSEIRDYPMSVNPLPTTDSTVKSEPTTTAHTVPSETAHPTTTTGLYTTTRVEASAKLTVCPENCYLDVTGVYCNCYQPVEVVIGNQQSNKQ